MDRPIATARIAAAPLLLLLIAACSSSAPAVANTRPAAAVGGPAPAAMPTRPVAVVEGFAGPEAVRYDPDQDVYFVANFNGAGSAADDNGFISRVSPDGQVQALRWVAGGTGGVTLHAPRGMALAGDTLWVADVGAVRGFDRRTGAVLATVSFEGMDEGFLNDVAVGPDGALYVTDTGRDRIYRVSGGRAEVAVADSALGSPNGITWDRTGGRFVVVPFGGASTIHSWRPGTTMLPEVGRGPGARYDGVEVLTGGGILVASQADSSLHLFERGEARQVVRTAGRPADIGVDTRRNRVAVPYIALNMVEIWELPER